jgi:hypothetical protein
MDAKIIALDGYIRYYINYINILQLFYAIIKTILSMFCYQPCHALYYLGNRPYKLEPEY